MRFCRILITSGVLLMAAVASANTLNPTQNAALSGTWGLEVDYTGSASLAYLQSADRGTNPHPWNDEKTINISFIINPGMPGDICYAPGGDCFGLTPPTFDVPTHTPATPGEVRIGLLYQDWIVNGVKVVLFLKRSAADDAWRLSAWVRQDNDNNTGAFVFGGEGYLCGLGQTCVTEVKFSWSAASAPGANDGSVRMTRRQVIPGATEQTMFERTNLDNDTHHLNIFWVGSVDDRASVEKGSPEGTVYFDDFAITR